MKYYNPALHEEPRDQQIPVIPLQQEESLINWLRSTGRLISRWSNEIYYDEQEEETEELTEIMDSGKRYDFHEEEEEHELWNELL